MSINRRHFTGVMAGMFGALAHSLSRRSSSTLQMVDGCELPESIRALRPITGGIEPITAGERLARLARARTLMSEQGISALVLEGGTSLYYYTGVRWGLSERPFGVVIPSNGALAWICPGFEEARARERIGQDAEVRVWQEDESPYRLLAGILADRGVRTGRVGIEERLRFFVFDGLRNAAPNLEYVSADPVTAGCRMIKSPAELALLQRSNDVTLAACRAAFATLREGMTQYDLQSNMEAAMLRLGGDDGSALVGFGASSAFPHGSEKPQKLREGDIVLLDSGCTVEGYESDITRTTVFGKPSPRQTQIWNLERKAQDAAFAAVIPGATCESVDAAARKVITDAGFGPDYKVPGLPHRTGHGIGLDGHEWTNLVRGNATRLAPGMCFSNEPMIAIYGEFGIRLEDCFHVTATGAASFTPQSIAIDRPFG
ncbi:MAG: Xaa-Pro peptidase family protein [Gemmatimonadota bacterium]